jgi:hypothetical protein
MRDTADTGAPSSRTAATSRGRDLALRAFAFEVVTLDQSGRQTQRRLAHAQHFSKDGRHGHSRKSSYRAGAAIATRKPTLRLRTLGSPRHARMPATETVSFRRCD